MIMGGLAMAGSDDDEDESEEAADEPKGDDSPNLNLTGEDAKVMKDATNYAMQLMQVNGRGEGMDAFIANALTRKGYSEAVINYVLVQLGL